MQRKKALHLTFHYGTANDVNFIFNNLGYDVTFFSTTSWPYCITKDLAESIWNQYQEYFQSFDIIVTSDTAALSYPLLLHIDELQPFLVIWICNRFNIAMENQQHFENLFRSSVERIDKVKMIPYTEYEIIWCERFNVKLKEGVITSLGRYETPYMSEEHVMHRCFRPLDVSHMFLPQSESIFIQDYHNNMQLYTFLHNQGVSVAFGRYMDVRELIGYKAVVAFPDAFCKIFYMEAIQHGIIVLLPSKQYLYKLLSDGEYGFTSKQYVTTLDVCEYYKYPDCYIFFDDIVDIPDILQKLDCAIVKTRLQKQREIVYNSVMKKWLNVVTSLPLKSQPTDIPYKPL